MVRKLLPTPGVQLRLPLRLDIFAGRLAATAYTAGPIYRCVVRPSPFFYVGKARMWLPAKELLTSEDVDKQSLFILQSWHELLSPTSPDSFRARVLNVFLLLDELSRVAALARDDA